VQEPLDNAATLPHLSLIDFERLGRVDIDSAVALRNRDRRVFGTASWLEGERIAFFSYGELLVGERLELRLELTHAYDSASAEVVVVEARRDGGGPTIYVAELCFLPEVERRKLFHWAEERVRVNQAHHSTPLSASPASQISQISEVSHSSGGATEGSQGSADGEASNLPAEGRSGRTAIREALRKGLAKRLERSSRVAPPHPTAPGPALIGLDDGLLYDDLKIEPLTEEELRPRAEISLSRDGATLHAVWNTWADLHLDWEISLSQSRFVAPLPAPHPPGGYALTLRMTLPDGAALAVPAQVRGSVENMLVLDLSFPEPALRRIKRAAQGS
jgi:hypothetical protein